jgi:hypothetical protein
VAWSRFAPTELQESVRRLGQVLRA